LFPAGDGRRRGAPAAAGRGARDHPAESEEPMSFCTSINCLDGRVQIPVMNYLLERFGATYVDVITELAPSRILAEQKDHAKIATLLRQVNVSVLEHGSQKIALIGHYDCSGNPVDKEQLIEQIKKGVAFLREAYPGLEVIGLRLASQWRVDEIS
jgi:carbonic anhydrase